MSKRVLSFDDISIETFDPVPQDVAYYNGYAASGPGCTVDTTCAPTCGSSTEETTGSSILDPGTGA